MRWSERMHGMRFAVTRTAGQTTILLAGELDVASVSVLVRELPPPEEYSERVVLDLSRVTYCGLAGVDLLLALHQQVTDGGGELALWGTHSAVLRMVRLSGGSAVAHLMRACVDGHRFEHHVNHALVREALGVALRIADAPMGSAQAPDPRTGVLRIVAQQGFGLPFLRYFETVADQETACGVAARNQRPVFVEEVSSSPIFLGTPAMDTLDDARVGAVASLPISTPSGTLLGVVSVHLRRPTPWPVDLRRTLRSLARSSGGLALPPQ